MKTYGTGLRDPRYLEGVARREWEAALKAHQETRRVVDAAERKYQDARTLAARKSADDLANTGDEL